MYLKDYFSFTRGEKRGVVFLLFIIILLTAVIPFIDYLKINETTDFSEFETAINEFEKEREQNSKANNSEQETLAVELFEFNPNTISDEEWVTLGFKEWQIKTINNYKAKGGNWKTKADVAKIYGLKEGHFQQLEPYILLPDEIEKKEKSYSKKENTKIEYFKFNPNTISKAQWKKLGFKDWQIKTIFNYKAKGGSWRSKADVKKIYGLDEADYHKLEPYILLPDKAEKKEYNNKKDYSKKVNVNTANAKELTNLKGIFSEKYAAIIIRYRTELGGFIKKEQLKEVWNMKKETYNGFINQVIIGNSQAKQININTATTEQLKKHPYINWNTANAIVKYRKANGNYKEVENIKKIHLINNETYLKIEPYLKIN
jgi:competence ComEA-like helix-hairpin-helix protein